MSDTHDHSGQDPDAKSDPRAYQEDFLRECAAAVDAGFEPADDDPVYETDPDKIEAAWREAGQ